LVVAGYLGSLGVILPTVLPGYLKVMQALTRIMRGLPGVIVTIDGRDGVGKTTFGRYLAWYFNVTLIEADLFLIPSQDYLTHLDYQVNRIIERRFTLPRPVIVEGVSMLQLMKRINLVPDFAIYITNPQHSGSRALEQQLSAYEESYAPSKKANMVVEIEH
jgi:2-phosphoglycerate kinase